MQHSDIKQGPSVNQSNLLEETIMSIVEKCVNQLHQKNGAISAQKANNGSKSARIIAIDQVNLPFKELPITNESTFSQN